MSDYIPGIQLFHMLQIEQTTPAETVVFFAVMVAFFMLGAVSLYIAVMTAIWYFRFRRENTPLHLVFLPTGKQFREHAAEYLLATATSIILMFSLMAKHTTVEYLKMTLSKEIIASAEDCRRTLDLEHVFPVHACPGNLANVGVLNVLQVAEAQGQSNEAEFVLKSLYRREQDKQALPAAWITEGRLRGACILLLSIYVLWLARSRFKQLAAKPDGSESIEYLQAARPLLALSVCAALLLIAAPAVLPTAENVASATIASIRDEAPIPKEQEAQIGSKFESQRHNLSLLEGDLQSDQTESLFAIVNRVRDRVEEVDRSLRAQNNETRAEIQSLADLHRRDVEGLRASQNSDRDRLSTMGSTLESQGKEIQALQAALSQTEAGWQAGISGQQKLLDQLQSSLMQVRTQADQMKSSVQSTVANLSTRIDAFAADIGQIQTILKDLDSGVNRQIQIVRNDLQNHAKNEAIGQSELGRRVSSLEQARQRIDQLAKQLGELTTRVNNYHQVIK